MGPERTGSRHARVAQLTALTWPDLQQQLMAANQQTLEYILSSPTWVQAWIVFMFLVLSPSYLLAFRYREARWVAFSLHATVVLTPFLIATAGASRFWGVTHIAFWPAGIVAALSAVRRVGSDNGYGRWMALVALTMLTSLAFDLNDLWRFVHA